MTNVGDTLVKALVSECLTQGGDQTQWVLLGPDDRKIVVLVTATDATSERLLEFLDGQLDSGLMRRAE